ncbi:hypothetical protein KA005_46865, partial [bacterium]|nr:hypothetical protein [bacterium]
MVVFNHEISAIATEISWFKSLCNCRRRRFVQQTWSTELRNKIRYNFISPLKPHQLRRLCISCAGLNIAFS